MPATMAWAVSSTASQLMTSRSLSVRKERATASRYMDSRMLVLPWALAPTSTMGLGGRSSSNSRILRKLVRLRCERYKAG